jgi:hypothetical protein
MKAHDHKKLDLSAPSDGANTVESGHHDLPHLPFLSKETCRHTAERNASDCWFEQLRLVNSWKA